MSNYVLIDPTVGSWYRDTSDRRFEVVAYDEQTRTAEIQYFDGAIEELDAETWRSTVAEEIAAPEDWSGPFDDVEKDDLGDTERPMRPEDWDGPWDELDNED